MNFSDVPPSPAHPLQNLRELGALWEYVAARPHARVLEIGSLYGGTLWYWSHLPHIEELTSIDMPPNEPTPLEIVRHTRPHWQEWFGLPPRFVDCPYPSMSPYPISVAARRAPFDLVFIDGDHSYNGVRRDFETYMPFVARGGIVAFHDTWPNYDRHEPGVVRWCDELRHRYFSTEWTDPDGVGICAFTID